MTVAPPRGSETLCDVIPAAIEAVETVEIVETEIPETPDTPTEE